MVLVRMVALGSFLCLHRPYGDYEETDVSVPITLISHTGILTSF